VNPQPEELFFSHAHDDAEFAMRVVTALREHGIRVWYAPHEILGAQQWHDEIGSALARCDWFVVLLSPRSVQSKWVKLELLYALRSDRYDDRILPLLMEDCDIDMLSWTLGGLQNVDFRSDFETACRELMRVSWGRSVPR
jgi:hypothetical protein